MIWLKRFGEKSSIIKNTVSTIAVFLNQILIKTPVHGWPVALSIDDAYSAT